MTRSLASATFVAFFLQAAWLLVWPLPRGPLQAAATVVVPSLLFLLAACAVWSWRRVGVAQPLLGAALGTVALWALVLVRNDAHEVGTSSAVIEGLATGGLYALLAIGLSLIFGVLGIINFAQGSFAVLGGLLMVELVDGLGNVLDPSEHTVDQGDGVFATARSAAAGRTQAPPPCHGPRRGSPRLGAGWCRSGSGRAQTASAPARR